MGENPPDTGNCAGGMGVSTYYDAAISAITIEETTGRCPGKTQTNRLRLRFTVQGRMECKALSYTHFASLDAMLCPYSLQNECYLHHQDTDLPKIYR